MNPDEVPSGGNHSNSVHGDDANEVIQVEEEWDFDDDDEVLFSNDADGEDILDETAAGISGVIQEGQD